MKRNDSNEKSTEINLDRPRRVRTTVGFWLLLLGTGFLLAFLMQRFTGSKLIAYGMAGALLLYMLVMSAITQRNLSKQPGEGRLD